MQIQDRAPLGQLAAQFGYRLPLRVLSSAAGYYIGTAQDDGPVTRESLEYFASCEAADEAFATGRWTQRDHV